MRKLRVILFVAFAIIVVIMAVWGWLATAHGAPEGRAETWNGADVNVVEKIASEHGREASPPLINTNQGDLLLFVFAAAGAVGGFIAGYCWRKLITDRTTKDNS